MKMMEYIKKINIIQNDSEEDEEEENMMMMKMIETPIKTNRNIVYLHLEIYLILNGHIYIINIKIILNGKQNTKTIL